MYSKIITNVIIYIFPHRKWLIKNMYTVKFQEKTPTVVKNTELFSVVMQYFSSIYFHLIVNYVKSANVYKSVPLHS